MNLAGIHAIFRNQPGDRKKLFEQNLRARHGDKNIVQQSLHAPQIVRTLRDRRRLDSRLPNSMLTDLNAVFLIRIARHIWLIHDRARRIDIHLFRSKCASHFFRTAILFIEQFLFLRLARNLFTPQNNPETTYPKARKRRQQRPDQPTGHTLERRHMHRRIPDRPPF